jgi:hypothetical protein
VRRGRRLSQCSTVLALAACRFNTVSLKLKCISQKFNLITLMHRQVGISPIGIIAQSPSTRRSRAPKTAILAPPVRILQTSPSFPSLKLSADLIVKMTCNAAGVYVLQLPVLVVEAPFVF